MKSLVDCFYISWLLAFAPAWSYRPIFYIDLVCSEHGGLQKRVMAHDGFDISRGCFVLGILLPARLTVPSPAL
jgi:hypothetical protein